MFVDVDYMKYSIIKAINVYRPQNVIEAIYKEPQIFVKELRSFLEDRIIKNQANTALKEHENQAFQEILLLLEDTEVPETLDWSYFAPFDGFKKLLTEMNCKNKVQSFLQRVKSFLSGRSICCKKQNTIKAGAWCKTKWWFLYLYHSEILR